MRPQRLTRNDSVNEDVRIRLKWGTSEYTGHLVSVDSYMNIQLSDAEEFMDGKSTGSLGQVLIRYAPLSIINHREREHSLSISLCA